jgi:hypothetical protein
VGAVLGFVDRMETEIGKGRQALIGNEGDAASVPAAAAVRSAFGDFVFPAKADAAVSPSAGLEDDFHLINEHRG